MSVEINLETHEIVVEVEYQEKGDKGKDAYQEAVDLGFVGTREEWIESLKQPALDAAALANDAADNADDKAQLAEQSAQGAITATDNANEATTAAISAADKAITATDKAITASDNANNATMEAIDATQLAQVATQSANTATQSANQSATNADDKADLAQTATSNANSATSSANTAAQSANDAALVANNAKGWQAIESIENYQGKELRYISGWQGGTGVEPSTNVGLYFKVGGGFTDDKDLAVNFKGDINTRDLSISEYNNLPTKDPEVYYFIFKE